MSKFEESNFYKALQDFFINADKKTFLQFLAEFYNRTEGIIDKNVIQDDLIKELRELYLEFNEKGIDENIVREKVNYFLDNNVKIKDVISKLNTKANKTETENIQQQVNNLVLGAVGDGNNAEVVQARGYHNTLNDRLNIIEDDYIDLPIYKQINLADTLNKQENSYWKVDVPNTIPISGNAGGYTTIPRIKLKRGLTYYISNFFPNFTWITKQNGSEYNNVSFVDLGVSEPYIYTATEDSYLYLTYTGQHNNIMVIENANKKPTFDLRFNEFKTIIENYKYEYDKYGNKINVITVKKDGTGDSTTIKGAIELCKNSSIDNQYEILIYDGEYNVIEELGGTTYLDSIMSVDGAYGGLLLPDYVHLKGMGKSCDNVIITANVEQYSGFDFNTLDNAVTKISPLNLEKNNNIENLTIKAENCRYAVHDESNNSYQDYIRKMKNVRAIHNGNQSKYSWTSTNAIGSGSGSGAIYEFENCTFEGSLPYSIHDNTNFTKGNKFLFNNCKFLSTSSDKVACRFVTVSLENETVTHEVIINNCQFRGTLGQFEEANGKGRKFYIHGGGNSVVPYVYTNTSTTAVAKPIALNEEVQIMINKDTETINKGSLVRIFASGICKLTTSDKHLFYGIALEDIKSGENGHVKTKGYVYVNDTNFASFNVGDKIGINNGNLVVTTGNDYIGVTTDWNQMLLK